MKQPLNRNPSRLLTKAGWVCGLALLLSAGLGTSNSAQAATIYFLDNIFSSDGPPAAPPVGPAFPPLGIVTLTDLGDQVRFNVVNLAGTGTKLDSLYFNFEKGTLDPDQLVFSNVNAAGGTFTTVLADTTSSQGVGLKADGDGYFDGKFEYTTNNFLGHGQILSFDLGIAGQNLDPIHFNFLSIDPQGNSPGPFVLASHIKAFPGEGSAWVGTVSPVPLPPAALLFGSGLLAMVGWLRRRQSFSKRV
jgi:hypothetical protein